MRHEWGDQGQRAPSVVDSRVVKRKAPGVRIVAEPPGVGPVVKIILPTPSAQIGQASAPLFFSQRPSSVSYSSWCSSSHSHGWCTSRDQHQQQRSGQVLTSVQYRAPATPGKTESTPLVNCARPPNCHQPSLALAGSQPTFPSSRCPTFSTRRPRGFRESLHVHQKNVHMGKEMDWG